MNAKTRLSAKGQVVIPRDVRTALGLVPGQSLDVICTGGGVLLRPAVEKPARSFDEVLASIRSHVIYDGPPATLEEMDAAIDEMFAKGGPDWDQ